VDEELGAQTLLNENDFLFRHLLFRDFLPLPDLGKVDALVQLVSVVLRLFVIELVDIARLLVSSRNLEFRLLDHMATFHVAH